MAEKSNAVETHCKRCIEMNLVVAWLLIFSNLTIGIRLVCMRSAKRLIYATWFATFLPMFFYTHWPRSGLTWIEMFVCLGVTVCITVLFGLQKTDTGAAQ